MQEVAAVPMLCKLAGYSSAWWVCTFVVVGASETTEHYFSGFSIVFSLDRRICCLLVFASVPREANFSFCPKPCHAFRDELAKSNQQ